MPITLIADSVDELPEALRAVAKEDGGKYRVSGLPQGFAVENVQGLKTALAEERTARKALEKVAAQWSDLPEGTDPVEVKKAHELMRAGSLKSSKEIDDFKRALEEKTAGEIKKAGEKLLKRDAQLHKLMVDQAWTQELTSAGFGKALKLLLPMCRSQSAVEDVNGELKLVLKDEQGRPLISKKADNNDAMTIAEFVSGLREQSEYRSLCEAKPAGGTGGASQTGGSGRTGDAIDITKMSPAELIARGNRKQRV